jgi:diguanylate cyclase (GGDEF)-like protein
VMLLDLDGFKHVNDTLGHHHGDLVLQHVARLLPSAVTADAFVSRLGGDEFAVVVPDVDDPTQARASAERILTALREPLTVDGIKLEVNASLGIAIAPQHASDVASLLCHADMAMYQAKKGHRGVSVFDPSAHSPESPTQLALVGELRHGLAHDQLRLYVQPKALAETGRIVGVEALVRWQHPRHGLIMPDEFIPIAERNGLIMALTTEVLRLGIAAVSAWEASGTRLSIAVNLSPRGILDTGLAAQIAGLLAERDIDAALLTLELTESCMMTDPAGVAATMTELHQMGARLSIDDFGTGYSSLSSLRRLPLDEIKIDKSFVLGLEDSSDDETIVRSIVDLGTNLGLQVVAEGVENHRIWHLLHRMGCHQIQGYYLSRPMPVHEFPAWLAEYRGRAAPFAVAAAASPGRHPD